MGPSLDHTLRRDHRSGPKSTEPEERRLFYVAMTRARR
ncbi:3'-5' exonuclease [Burkholderia sp. JPY481]